MIPLVDLHCHLLAGMDDGPRTKEDALAMCRLAYAEGTRMVAALAHQNEQWCEVTPNRIREAVRLLAQQLRDEGTGLTVFPTAEVMVHTDIEAYWTDGRLLSIADRGQYLLVELPHGLFVDLTDMTQNLVQMGIRPVLAHPERQPELLEEPQRIERLVRAGCLVQVSSGSITDPPNRQFWQDLKDWLKRGLVHFLGSDGHSLNRRPPKMADAYKQIVRTVGASMADRICYTNGMAVLQGLPLRIAPFEPRRRHWFSKLW